MTAITTTQQTTGEDKPRRLWLKLGLMVGAAAVLVAIAARLLLGGVSGLMGGGGVGEEDAALTYAVKREPLTISITETGTINAREKVVLKSEIEGRSTIISLIEEGTRVEPGELLVELDSSELQDELVDQTIQTDTAESAYIGAEETLAVTQNQAESDIAQAELDYAFAQQDLKKYLEGEYKKEKDEAEQKAKLAEEELKQAETRLAGSRELYKKNFISKSELEQEELAVERSKLDLEIALGNLKLLEDYTFPRQKAQLESDIEQTKMALERVKRKAKADVVQAEADLRAKESKRNREREKLAKLTDQIEKAKIYAPREGMVVYATTGGSRWRDDEPLEEGSEVRERQEIIHLPSSSAMMVEVDVHESSLDKVSVGLPARVEVDAITGKVYTGRVAKISVLPKQQRWYNPDLKVYSVEVHIDGQARELRTGMSCRVEILVDHIEQALAVPVQSVLRQGNQPMVWLSGPKGLTPRAVEIGLDNGRMVHVLSGLEAGDRVTMQPPLEQSEVAAAGDGATFEGGQAGEAGDVEASTGGAASTASSGSAKWDSKAVATARQAMQAGDARKDQPKLSEEDQQLVQFLTMAKENGFLDRLIERLEPDIGESVRGIVAQMDAGEVPTISAEVKAAFKKMQQRMRGGQGAGGQGRGGQGGQSSGAGGGGRG